MCRDCARNVSTAVQSSDYYESRYIDVDPSPYYVSERTSLVKTQAM